MRTVVPSSRRIMLRSALAGLWLVAALPFGLLFVFIGGLMTSTEKRSPILPLSNTSTKEYSR